MPINPSWTRDEVILALDLYFRHGRRYVSPAHPDVIELSKLLNRLPIHASGLRDAKFRNPSGVAMKIGNLMSYDPDQKSSLPSSSRTDKAVWEEFSSRPDELSVVAEAIRQASSAVQAPTEDEDDEFFPEGRVLERMHKRRERNRLVVLKKLAQVLQETGKLACEACGFDFQTFYGERGEGFAECHHTRPLSEVGERKTRLADLAVVCANCHCMIHRGAPTLTVEQLRALIFKS